MQALFIVVAVIGLCYFLFAKRRFDFFSVGYFAALLYFSPGFFGFVPYLTPEPMLWRLVEILPETYGIMIAVYVAILIGAIIYDIFCRQPESPISAGGTPMATEVLLWVACGALFLTFLTVGPMLFSPDKVELARNLNRWFIIWVYAASLAACLAITHRQKALLWIAMVFLLFDVFIGFRDVFTVTVVALFVLYFLDKGKQRLAVNHWKAILAGTLMVVFVLVYKPFFTAVKIFDADQIETMLQNPVTYAAAFMNSEPFVQQAILNEVVRIHFKTDVRHFELAFSNFVLFAQSFGENATSFHDQYVYNVFPELLFADWGPASNIWAEMWSTGGWSLLLAFILFFVGVLYFGSYALRRWRNPSLQAIIALLLSFWAFFIHRNELAVAVGIQKDLVLGWVFAIVMSKILLRARANYWKRADGKPLLPATDG